MKNPSPGPVLALLVSLLFATIVPVAAQTTGPSPTGGAPVPPELRATVKVVAEWLSIRRYEGGFRDYTVADLTVSPAVDRALQVLGLSHFSVLRNECYARYGYIFRTPALDMVFRATTWYRPDPSASLASLSPRENRNVTFIKNLEDSYDHNLVRSFLQDLGTRSSPPPITEQTLSLQPGPDWGGLNVPPALGSALAHLNLNPSGILRAYVLAKLGYDFTDPQLAGLFKGLAWYRPQSRSLEALWPQVSPWQAEWLAVLEQRKLVDLKNAVIYSMPPDVTVLPALDYTAIFLKRFTQGDRTYHTSTLFSWNALTMDTQGLVGSHQTDVEALVSPEVRALIEAEADPARKLRLFFEHKRYAGYVDTLAFNETDFRVPSYLAAAVQQLGLNWPRLLRKEIHARHGARFSDFDTFRYFQTASWYKPRHNLVPGTLSRFPASEVFKGRELSNYALIEGEELAGLTAQALDQYRAEITAGSALVVVDLSGNVYIMRTALMENRDPGEYWIKTVELGGLFKLGADGSLDGGIPQASPEQVKDQLWRKYQERYDELAPSNVYYQGGC